MLFFHLSEHFNTVRTDKQNALGFLYPTFTYPLQLPPPGVTLVKFRESIQLMSEQ